MRYEEFKAAWDEALRESHLPVIGGSGGGEETLELRWLDRRYKVYVEPIGGQHVEPFTVTATLSWRWKAELTARSATTEEDLLRSLLGREEADEIETEQPWLREMFERVRSALHAWMEVMDHLLPPGPR